MVIYRICIYLRKLFYKFYDFYNLSLLILMYSCVIIHLQWIHEESNFIIDSYKNYCIHPSMNIISYFYIIFIILKFTIIITESQGKILERTSSSPASRRENCGESPIKCIQFIRKELSWTAILRCRPSHGVYFSEKETVVL